MKTTFAAVLATALALSMVVPHGVAYAEQPDCVEVVEELCAADPDGGPCRTALNDCTNYRGYPDDHREAEEETEADDDA